MENKLLTESQCKNMEAAMQLAELAIDNTLKIETLLAELALRLVQESVASAKALSAVENVREIEIADLRAQYARQTTMLMIEGAQKLAAIGTDIRARFSRLLTERLASGSHELLDAFQAFFRVLPSQNPDAIETMQQAMAHTHSAFEHIAAVSAAAIERRKVRRPAAHGRRAGARAQVESRAA